MLAAVPGIAAGGGHDPSVPGAPRRAGVVLVPQTKGFRVAIHELHTATRLAARGHRVEFLVPANRQGIRTPDILLDGQRWEMKSPRGTSTHTISNQLRRAGRQCDHLVLDTARTVLDDDDIVSEVRRRLSGPRARLARVMTLVKDGSVVVIERSTSTA